MEENKEPQKEKSKECWHMVPEDLLWDWDMLGKEIKCPDCGQICTLEYDEYYNVETDDCDEWWFLEPIDIKSD